METIFGDGSQQQTGGVMDALLGAGKRLLTGESLFMTVFTNQGAGQAAGRVRARRIPARSSRWTCARSAASSSARRTRSCAPPAASRSASRSRGRSASACSAARASSCRSSKATACASSTPAARSITLDLARRRDAARRHRLPGGAAAERQLRHPVRRQGQDRALRRRGHVLRDAARARARCGCSRCRSAAWPIASTRRRRRRGRRSEEGSILGGLGDLLDGR